MIYELPVGLVVSIISFVGAVCLVAFFSVVIVSTMEFKNTYFSKSCYNFYLFLVKLSICLFLLKKDCLLGKSVVSICVDALDSVLSLGSDSIFIDKNNHLYKCLISRFF